MRFNRSTASATLALPGSTALAVIVGAGMAATSGPAKAQSQQQNQSAQTERGEAQKLEEIVVTAQKREESLQDIPMSVTAMSGEMLENNDINSLEEIGQQTPGMEFSAFTLGQPEIAIRGVSTKEDGPAASDAVVVSVDGVYIAARSAQVFDIFDLERVEVARGPQGTLAGKNSIAGSINFVTSKPGPETEIRLRQSVGNFDTFDTQGLISGQIAENLYGKVSFSRRKHDGFLTNVLEEYVDPVSGQLVENEDFGQDQGEKNTFSWRAHLRWEPSSDFDVTLMLDGADDDQGQSNREPVDSAGVLHGCPNCASNPVAVNEALGGADSPFTTLAETEGFVDREMFGISLKANYDFDFATLTTIYSHRESDFEFLEDSEGLPPFAPSIDLTGISGNPGPLLTAPADRGFTFDINDSANEESDQDTLQFRLTSPETQRFTWMVGGLLSFEDIDRSETFFFPTLGGPPAPAGQDPDFPFGRSDATSFQDNDGLSLGVFSQVTYNVTDRLKLTGGVRFSYDEKDLIARNELDSGLPLLLRGFDQVTASEDWNEVSWRFAADYRVTDEVLLYFLTSTGHKAGGFVGSATTADVVTDPFGKETAINFEGGVKGEFFDRSLRLNLTAFWMEIDDLQVTRFFQPADSQFGQFITENAGEAQSRGIELEFTVLPAEGLEIGGSYAFLDAEFEQFTGQPSVAPDGSIIEPGTFDGNDLRQSPPHTASGYVKYTYTDSWGALTSRISARFQDDMFFDPSNNPTSLAPSHDIWDARLSYQTPDEKWKLSLWGKNIFDEEYIEQLFTQRGGRIAFGIFGDPARYGASVEYSF